MAYVYGTDEWEKAYLAEVERRKTTESKPYIVATPEWTAEGSVSPARAPSRGATRT